MTEKALTSDELTCDDCQSSTTWKYAIQTDPWDKPTGDILCENCAEKRWDQWQQHLMEVGS